MSSSDIKLKVIPLFPPKTTAQQGLRLDKNGPKWAFSLDYAGLAFSTPAVGQQIAVFDGSNYFLAPSPVKISAAGGASVYPYLLF